MMKDEDIMIIDVTKLSVEEVRSLFSLENIQAILEDISKQIRTPQKMAKDTQSLEQAKIFHKQIKNDQAKFKKKIDECKQHVQTKISQKFDLLKVTSRYLEEKIVSSNRQMVTLKENISEANDKLVNEQKWIKMTEKILANEVDLQEAMLKTHLDQQKECKAFNNVLDILNNALWDRRKRIYKVEEFMKNMKKPVTAPLQSKRISFKQKNITSVSSKPEVEFCPQSMELIFNLYTFERQPVVFILFYDESHKKFGLKNPRKDFRLNDIHAVRAFNYHKSIPQFYKQLCYLVTKYIDDADLIFQQQK